MTGKTQADITIGLPTLDRASPDYYALSFANHILGRIYFMGRFGEKVRDEQGLAYYAYSELNAGYGRGGWIMRAGVNPTNLDKALDSISHELERFLADGPTEAEQADGVASLLGSLPRQLETNEGAAAVISEIELYGLGLDYLERFPDIVRSLTREQVTETARRWIDPHHLVTAIGRPAARWMMRAFEVAVSIARSSLPRSALQLPRLARARRTARPRARPVQPDIARSRSRRIAGAALPRAQPAAARQTCRTRSTPMTLRACSRRSASSGQCSWPRASAASRHCSWRVAADAASGRWCSSTPRTEAPPGLAGRAACASARSTCRRCAQL